jgi:hypothetical protein
MNLAEMVTLAAKYGLPGLVLAAVVYLGYLFFKGKYELYLGPKR